MRGETGKQKSMMIVFNVEAKIRKDHPVRQIKALADEALVRLSPVFDGMYSKTGRPSIPPERLLKSVLLMALYSVPSERQFCERLDLDFLFRWFLDMDVSEDAFDPTTFTQNRDRLLAHAVAEKFFHEVVLMARAKDLMSDEHFSVDGTLIEAWASMKSFRPRDEKPEDRPKGDGGSNGWVDFSGEKRSNATHASTTDPEANLLKKSKGQSAKLCYTGHALMDNRNGLLHDFWVTPSVGITEGEAAGAMLEGAGLRGSPERGISVGADKGYDNEGFVEDCRDLGIIPHVARKKNGAMDEATALTLGYSISQRLRKRIEEIFGWMKTVACFRKSRFIGLEKTRMAGYFVGTAYNLMRIARWKPRVVNAEAPAAA
jgi:transposase